MKLYDRYIIAPMDTPTWKIYDKNTRRKLCDDYGSVEGFTPLDDMSVWSMSLKTTKDGRQYVRVSVQADELMLMAITEPVGISGKGR